MRGNCKNDTHNVDLFFLTVNKLRILLVAMFALYILRNASGRMCLYILNKACDTTALAAYISYALPMSFFQPVLLCNGSPLAA